MASWKSRLLEERITNSTLAIALGFYKSNDKEEKERSGEERERITRRRMDRNCSVSGEFRKWSFETLRRDLRR